MDSLWHLHKTLGAATVKPNETPSRATSDIMSMAQPSWSPIKKETTQFWVLVSVLIGTLFFLIAPPVLYLICDYRSNRAVGQEQAILVLGGNWTRIASIKPIITKLPQIPVVMSFTQIEAQYGLMVLERYGVPKSQIFHDCRAVDTVSNFTTTIDFFRKRKISNVFIVTDSEHMKRAMLIARYILGFYGIKATPHPAGLYHPRSSTYWGGESILRRARDAVRSTLWILLGVDLSSLTLLLPDWYREQGSNCAANDGLASRSRKIAAQLQLD